MRRALVLVGCLALLPVGARLPAAAQTAPPEQLCSSIFTLSGDRPVVLPAEFTKFGIAVRVTIANHDYKFIVDSGTSVLTIDPGVAHRLGLPAADINGSPQVTIPELNIGPVVAHAVTFDQVSLDRLEFGPDIAGLLGCNFFAGAVVAIDFNAGTVTLYPSASFDPRKAGVVWQTPVVFADGAPFIAASIEGIVGSFIVDTGSFTTELSRPYMEKLPSVVLSGTDVSDILSVSGDNATTVYNVRDLRFGPFHIVHLPVVVRAHSAVTAYDGILGRNVLAYGILFFDYQHATLYFKPNLE